MAAVIFGTFSGPTIKNLLYLMSENALRKMALAQNIPNLSLRESLQCKLDHDSLNIGQRQGHSIDKSNKLDFVTLSMPSVAELVKK